jgi:cell division septum initiation protein DivIVA
MHPSTAPAIRAKIDAAVVPKDQDVSELPQTVEEQSQAPPGPPEVEPDQLPRALFGYERSTIVELLDTMSTRIRELVQERAERERRIGELEEELGRGRESQRLIGETLVRAREEAEAIREEARRSAEQDLQSTRAEAERDLKSTRAEAERIIAEAELAATEKVAAMIATAQEQRQAIIEEAQQERQALLEEAGRARAFVDETHEQLSDFLMAAVRWYEQARPSAERGSQVPTEPESSPNETSSISSDLTAALTRESQSTPSSTGRSDE